jgi:hypothetical protein
VLCDSTGSCAVLLQCTVTAAHTSRAEDTATTSRLGGGGLGALVGKEDNHWWAKHVTVMNQEVCVKGTALQGDTYIPQQSSTPPTYQVVVVPTNMQEWIRHL